MEVNHELSPRKETESIVDSVFRRAFTDVLYDKARGVLCPKCSTVLESAALDRYMMLMAKRREEIASLQTKAQKERKIDARRRELEKQNKVNNPSKGADQ